MACHITSYLPRDLGCWAVHVCMRGLHTCWAAGDTVLPGQMPAELSESIQLDEQLMCSAWGAAMACRAELQNFLHARPVHGIQDRDWWQVANLKHQPLRLSQAGS